METLPRHDTAVNLDTRPGPRPASTYRHTEGDSREVIVRLDYDSRTAEIWCARRTCEGRLRRLGYKETCRQIGGVWFTAPMKAITFRSMASAASKTARRGNPAALARAQEARTRNREAPAPAVQEEVLA